jgi:low affinity Fe/Cu permease
VRVSPENVGKLPAKSARLQSSVRALTRVRFRLTAAKVTRTAPEPESRGVERRLARVRDARLREAMGAGSERGYARKMPRGINRRSWFTRFAKATSHWAGRPASFIVAFAVILTWAISGPIFGYSDTWQLVINTGTTIVTFLMVFLIQNTQNRDAEAMHLKLDELIRVLDRAHDALLDLEELEDEELDQKRAEYVDLARKARGELRKPVNKRPSSD